MFPAQSFGRDKEIYIYFFIAVVLYNFVLCFYAVSKISTQVCRTLKLKVVKSLKAIVGKDIEI